MVPYAGPVYNEEVPSCYWCNANKEKHKSYLQPIQTTLHSACTSEISNFVFCLSCLRVFFLIFMFRWKNCYSAADFIFIFAILEPTCQCGQWLFPVGFAYIPGWPQTMTGVQPAPSLLTTNTETLRTQQLQQKWSVSRRESEQREQSQYFPTAPPLHVCCDTGTELHIGRYLLSPTI